MNSPSDISFKISELPPELRDMIFEFLEFEIQPGFLKPDHLVAIEQLNPGDRVAALKYCCQANYFLSIGTLEQFKRPTKSRKGIGRLRRIKHLNIQWEPTADESFRGLANHPLMDTEDNRLETITLDLSSRSQNSKFPRGLSDDMVSMIRDLVKASAGRVHKVTLVVRFDMSRSLPVEIMIDHLSWRLSLHKPVESPASRGLKVYTWEGNGEDFAEAIKRTDELREPEFGYYPGFWLIRQ
ncbi:hypothetical protein EG329_012161 [Mollisiaceae sp. DMI_Dod_QoI]|nr:hypothetical protein EG329_012161 [Helotiales sp. DMI_Dod_QoI]